MFPSERVDDGDFECHHAAGVTRRRQGVCNRNCSDDGLRAR